MNNSSRHCYNYQNSFIVVYFIECRCEVVSPLTDIEVAEGASVTLAATLSKPRQVVWRKHGEVLSAGGRVTVSVDEDGLTHRLSVQDVTVEENAEFSIETLDSDYGGVSSSCKINVKGIL